MKHQFSFTSSTQPSGITAIILHKVEETKYVYHKNLLLGIEEASTLND